MTLKRALDLDRVVFNCRQWSIFHLLKLALELGTHQLSSSRP